MDWVKIKTEYIQGHISYKKLSDKYGISINTIKQRGKNEHWVDAKTDNILKLSQKAQKEIMDHRATDLVSLYKINDMVFEKLKSLLQMDLNPRELLDTVKTLKMVVDIKREELGISNEDRRLELDKEKLELLKEKSVCAVDNSECGVILMPAIMNVPEHNS